MGIGQLEGYHTGGNNKIMRFLFSVFQIHCRWIAQTTSPSSCNLEIKVGKINGHLLFSYVSLLLIFFIFIILFDQLFSQILISGAHFKKWCPMQSKIKSGAVDEVCILFFLYIILTCEVVYYASLKPEKWSSFCVRPYSSILTLRLFLFG